MTMNFAFLHGGGQGSWVWRSTIDALTLQAGNDAVRVIALDVPGCGTKRGETTDELTPADVATQLTNELEQSGLGDIILVGHSLAGNVLPAMAELKPGLFRRLVYLSCSIPLPGQTVLEMIGNKVHGADENEVGWPVDPSTTPMERRYEVMYGNDLTSAQKEALLAELNQDHWPMSFFDNRKFEFRTMGQVPSTYLLCLTDNILPHRWQQIFAERFKAERVVRIDAGHQAMISRPHTVAEILRLEAGR